MILITNRPKITLLLQKKSQEMLLVHVDLAKNSRNVVELYKINKVREAIITTVATAIAIFFLDLIISFKSNPEV